MRELAAAALDNRAAGVLWLREAGYASSEVREELHEEFTGLQELLRERLRAKRPSLEEPQADLLASSALAALASVSFHSLHLSPRRFVALLYEAVRRICDTTPPTTRGEASAAATFTGRVTMRPRR
ncbi:hypothetical protein AB0J21_16540 [Streptomyces sp. NPDC049954]|uniref:hypothetical protein n=1 Tax=Streptomyces sp. NPDC049954 TaxID=3155779 RepID=UPI00341E87A5